MLQGAKAYETSAAREGSKKRMISHNNSGSLSIMQGPLVPGCAGDIVGDAGGIVGDIGTYPWWPGGYAAP